MTSSPCPALSGPAWWHLPTRHAPSPSPPEGTPSPSPTWTRPSPTPRRPPCRGPHCPLQSTATMAMSRGCQRWKKIHISFSTSLEIFKLKVFHGPTPIFPFFIFFPQDFFPSIPVHPVISSISLKYKNQGVPNCIYSIFPPTIFFVAILCSQLIVPFLPDTNKQSVPCHMSYFPTKNFFQRIPVRPVYSYFSYVY